MIKPVKLHRQRLIKIMDALAGERLIYIHGPAGYGKTTAAQMWVEHMEKKRAKAALISPDEFDNKSAGFFGKFARALLNLQPDNKKMSAFLLHPSFDSAPDECVVSALKEFEANESSYIITIDDLHVITNKQIFRLIPTLSKIIPHNITFLLISRNPPPDDFAEYVLKGNMGLIDASHLRFTTTEIKELFNAAQRAITTDRADEIFTTTGGWAIGLASILLSGENTFDTNFTAHYLETFFLKTLWDKWDDGMKHFLMDISVVEDFTPELTDVLTGGKSGKNHMQRLVSENIFLRNVAEDTYALHGLFREFLIKMLTSEMGEKYKNKQMKKAGVWFYKRRDYYRAVFYYMKAGDFTGASNALAYLRDYNAPYSLSIEDTIRVINLTVSEPLVSKHPFLLEALAYVAWLEGRSEDMYGYLQRYFKLLPKIILKNPSSISTAIMLRSMDYRNSLVEMGKQFQKMPVSRFAFTNTPSLTQHFPLMHRCTRDYSEYLANPDEDFPILYKTIGLFYRAERDALLPCVKAGLAYECGNLEKAQELSFTAMANMENSFAPEIQFSILMMHVHILCAQDDSASAEKIRVSIEDMIRRHNAYYLSANFRAEKYRLLFSNGDKGAAKTWISQYAAPLSEALPFYKMYQAFTTARAYIVIADYNSAILILNSLLKLCENYRRPLDIIDALILLAIAYWKKPGTGQDAAIGFLERALSEAYKYGYMQTFINDGPDIETILSKIQKRSALSENKEFPTAFVKSIHFAVLTLKKRKRGLSGNRLAENLTFTEKQKTVMRLIREGYSQSEIAEKMGTSINNVKSHVKLIYKKLDVSNAVDAVARINELGLLPGASFPAMRDLSL